jgi:hypothetical protein
MTRAECALCMNEADEGGPWLGLDWVCRPCRTGDVDRLVARWGLEPGTDRSDDDGRVWFVRVRRPTTLAASARLALEQLGHKARKLFGRKDPEVGDESFDDRIWVEADAGALDLLQDVAVRGAVVSLLQVPSVTLVELDGDSVVIHLHASRDYPDRLVKEVLDAPLELSRHRAVVLAARIERLQQTGSGAYR